jgi:hypothetical protein
VIVDGGDVIFFCEVESQIEIPRAASKRCAAQTRSESQKPQYTFQLAFTYVELVYKCYHKSFHLTVAFINLD